MTTDWMSSLVRTHSRVLRISGTILATTSGGKFCLEMTHNALVHVFLSVDFTTRDERADSSSSAKLAGERESKRKPCFKCDLHSYQAYLTFNGESELLIFIHQLNKSHVNI